MFDSMSFEQGAAVRELQIINNYDHKRQDGRCRRQREHVADAIATERVADKNIIASKTDEKGTQQEYRAWRSGRVGECQTKVAKPGS